MAEPHKGEAYDVPAFSLTDFKDPSKFVNNPTIVAGDFKISKDYGSLANLQTVPQELPAGSGLIKVSLTALEMTADKITIRARDQAGEQWKDLNIPIDIPDGNAEKATELLLGDMEVTQTRSITKRAGTGTIIRDKDVSGSSLGPDDVIRTTEPI